MKPDGPRISPDQTGTRLSNMVSVKISYAKGKMRLVTQRFSISSWFVRILILSLLFWLAWNGCPRTTAHGAEEKPAVSQGQLDVTVLHVDKYGIYVPEIVFYWDASLGKQKIAALTAAAERLRNKRATITYSAQGSPTRDKRPLVLDIVPYQEPVHTIQAWTEPDESAESSSASDHVAGISGQTRDPEPTQAFPQRDLGSSWSSVGEGPAGIQDQRRPGEESEIQTQVSAESLPIQKRDVLMLIEHLLHLTSKKSLDSILYYYADSVNYYARGDVSRDYIRRDLGYYFRNWDRIHCALEGDIQLFDTSRRDIKLVRFQSSYTVENAKRSISGTADNTWKVQRTRTGLKVIDQKQTVLSSRATDLP